MQALYTTKDRENEDEIMNISGTIECCNFELDAEDVTLNKLMNHMVYSPSTRYAATIMTLADNSARVFLLDVFNMTFYEYRNEPTENITHLKIEMFYWYGDECLVIISIDTPNRQLHQTPVILNHKEKTYEAKESVSYDSARKFIIDAPSSREANTIMYKGEKYLVIIGRQVRLYTFHIHLVPYHPYKSLPILKFKMFGDVNEQLTIVSKTNKWTGDIRFSPNISVVDNIVYFPIETNKNDLLGIHFALDFEKFREVTGFVLREDFVDVIYFMHDQSAAWEYKEHIDVDEKMDRQLAKETFCRNRGSSAFIKGNFFLASQCEHVGLKMTRVDFTDCTKGKLTTIHKSYCSRDREVAACLTPYNILMARKLSTNRISCSIIPYPCNNKTMPTLKEMALAHTYLKYKNVNFW